MSPKPYCPRPYLDGRGRLVITDWDGKLHKFNDGDKGLAFATKMYANPPKRPQYEPDGPMVTWQHQLPSIQVKPMRFSHGRAKQ